MAKIRLSSTQIENVVDAIKKFINSSGEAQAVELAGAAIPAISKALNELSFGREAPMFEALHQNELEERCRLAATEKLNVQDIFWMAFYAYSFLREQVYLEGRFGNIESGFFPIFERAAAGLSTDEMMRVRYLTDALPKDLLLWTAKSLKADIEKERAGYFHDVDQKVAVIKGWDDSLKSREIRVNEQIASLQHRLEKINFVGLSKAFQDQLGRLAIYKRNQIALLILVGFFLLFVPTIPFLLSMNGLLDLRVSVDLLPKVVPIAVMELVLFYFFRIFLRNFYSAEAQELQFSLRNSLCAFVESYAEFVGRMRSDGDKKVLEKFEALVFSGVTLDPANIPSQFDGLEQIARFVRDVKGGSSQ